MVSGHQAWMQKKNQQTDEKKSMSLGVFHITVCLNITASGTKFMIQFLLVIILAEPFKLNSIITISDIFL